MHHPDVLTSSTGIWVEEEYAVQLKENWLIESHFLQSRSELSWTCILAVLGECFAPCNSFQMVAVFCYLPPREKVTSCGMRFEFRLGSNIRKTEFRNPVILALEIRAMKGHLGKVIGWFRSLSRSISVIWRCFRVKYVPMYRVLSNLGLNYFGLKWLDFEI